jgi:hypothetical protein
MAVRPTTPHVSAPRASAPKPKPKPNAPKPNAPHPDIKPTKPLTGTAAGAAGGLAIGGLSIGAAMSSDLFKAAGNTASAAVAADAAKDIAGKLFGSVEQVFRDLESNPVNLAIAVAGVGGLLYVLYARK